MVFPLVKELKMSPKEIAEKVGDYLVETNSVVSFNVVSGFLNLSISDKYYLDFFNSIKDNKDLKIFLVGKIFDQLKFKSERIHFFYETSELMEHIKKNLIIGHTILLKGSRKINLEKVIPLL